MNKKRILRKILAGSKNIRFTEIVNLVQSFGFYLDRTSGSHHIFIHPEISELINLQNVNGQVKPYQLKQILRLIEKYNLRLEDNK